MEIGSRIKELRKSKRMTLTELSQKSGVQMATLSRIEHLKMTGTLESHLNIAKAMEVDITELYQGLDRSENNVDMLNANALTDVFVDTEKSAFRILTSNALKKKMLPTVLSLESDAKTNSEQAPIGTEKFIFVLEGKLEVMIANKAYPLSRSSTLYFDASLQHYYVNKGKRMAKALCVSTPAAL